MTKNTDCLCRRALGWMGKALLPMIFGFGSVLVGFFIAAKTRHHPVVSLSFYDKDDVLIFSDEIETKEPPLINLTYYTEIWPKNPTWALMKVRKEDIKHAHRVVVRLK